MRFVMTYYKLKYRKDLVELPPSQIWQKIIL